jgi:hypothetical protein
MKEDGRSAPKGARAPARCRQVTMIRSRGTSRERRPFAPIRSSGTRATFAIDRSWYHWSHEPCWVARKVCSKAKFLGPRDQGTIWRAPNPKMLMSGSSERKEDHPTQKPLVLFETPIRNHLQPGGAVYDPFLGSGDPYRRGTNGRPSVRRGDRPCLRRRRPAALRALQWRRGRPSR